VAWDFKERPELWNSVVDFYYWDSPHKQIFEDFTAKVVKVHDGDTITVQWAERSFDFPVRLLGIDAPELNAGGEASKQWLEQLLLDKEVDVLIDPEERVGKWGRILGTVMADGLNVNELSVSEGMSVPFDRREELGFTAAA
tara:strand:+ start:10267 stop:10689 length:423 start_codon:yes stop_codon:yes gene_type:complete